MTKEQLKQASPIMTSIESKTKQLNDLAKTDTINSVTLRYYQSGAPGYSYEVLYADDVEFMKCIKDQFRLKIQREIDALEHRLKEI